MRTRGLSRTSREQRLRRSSSVSKSRVSSASPLPSLQEDKPSSSSGPGEPKTNGAVPFLPYKRSNSVSDPLCVSTPKSYKMRTTSQPQNLKSRTSKEIMESDSDMSKVGTLTSQSSSSSVSPPSTETSRSRENCSYESLASLGTSVRKCGHASSRSR